MTLEEAKKVAAIASTADNGCPTCVSALAAKLMKAFPKFNWEHIPWYDDQNDGDEETIKVTLKQPT